VGAVALPFALPVLPVTKFIAYQAALGQKPTSSEKKQLGALPQQYADMHGWPELVEGVARAYDALDPEERASSALWVVSGGYGDAAALDALGRGRGLPQAISTHNSYWTWGYGEVASPRAVVVVGDSPRLAELFENLTLVTQIDCGYCMPYASHRSVYVGRGMRRSFAEIWPAAKHYE
jgi:hypothetical protein